MKKILLIVFALLSILNAAEYDPILEMESIKVGNEQRILSINEESFEFYKIYISKEDYEKIYEPGCLIQLSGKKDFVSLEYNIESDYAFVCGKDFYKVLNKDIKEIEQIMIKKGLADPTSKLTLPTTQLLIAKIINEYIVPRSGEISGIILVIITLILYLITKRGKIMVIGFLLALIIGIVMHYVVHEPKEYPYQKTYLTDFYDNLDRQSGEKVFRSRFH